MFPEAKQAGSYYGLPFSGAVTMTYSSLPGFESYLSGIQTKKCRCTEDLMIKWNPILNIFTPSGKKRLRLPILLLNKNLLLQIESPLNDVHFFFFFFHT